MYVCVCMYIHVYKMYVYINQTINLKEKNMGVNICVLGLGNGFLEMTPKAQAIKNWTSSKLKTVLQSKLS